jgi:hypothetical protein
MNQSETVVHLLQAIFNSNSSHTHLLFRFPKGRESFAVAFKKYVFGGIRISPDNGLLNETLLFTIRNAKSKHFL